jgi:hypothetical protein
MPVLYPGRTFRPGASRRQSTTDWAKNFKRSRHGMGSVIKKRRKKIRKHKYKKLRKLMRNRK